MKDYLAALVRTSSSPSHARNLVREYLQARIVGALQRVGAMIPLAFHGGTALRFLYSATRYSEDLDFTLEREKSQFNLRACLHAIRAELEAEGYGVELKVNDRKTVHSAFIRFPGLPYELDLSPHGSEVLTIKIEVDTSPPAGAVLATTVVRRHIVLQLQHHDRSSLLAGKLHALLQRSYTKGRDLYDLLWYLSDPNWPPPNLALLNNALKQTGWTGAPLSQNDWRQAVWERLKTAMWTEAVTDVRPFLESSANVSLLTPENIRRVLLSE